MVPNLVVETKTHTEEPTGLGSPFSRSTPLLKNSGSVWPCVVLDTVVGVAKTARLTVRPQCHTPVGLRSGPRGCGELQLRTQDGQDIAQGKGDSDLVETCELSCHWGLIQAVGVGAVL